MSGYERKSIFGEMPWVTLRRRVDALEAAQPKQENDEMKLNFENLIKEIKEVKAMVAALQKELHEEQAAYQAQIDALVADLEGLKGSGASEGGITA